MRTIIAAIGSVSVCASLLQAQPSVTPLPLSLSVEGLSADGRVVFGGDQPGGAGHAAYWTRAGGLVVLGLSPAKVTSSNWDGSVLAINSSYTGLARSWIWTQGGGATEILVPGLISVQASCMSRDGLVVAGGAVDTGIHHYHAFVWSLADGGRAVPEGVNYASWIHALSATGLKGVGSGSSGLGTWPMLWGSTYVWCESLGPLPNVGSGVAYAMTPDMSTVVGDLSGPGNLGTAFVWTAQTGLTVVPPRDGSFGVTLQAVSDDGAIAVGSEFGGGVIWRKGVGLLPADQYFYSRGLNAHTPQLIGISANGRVFCDARTLVDLGPCGSADFNHDGDSGTDADIEAFFACLAGDCCPLCDSADFNYDGDAATDADIEAFFRVLAGGTC